jgi:hypothetical protein
LKLSSDTFCIYCNNLSPLLVNIVPID